MLVGNEEKCVFKCANECALRSKRWESRAHSINTATATSTSGSLKVVPPFSSPLARNPTMGFSYDDHFLLQSLDISFCFAFPNFTRFASTYHSRNPSFSTQVFRKATMLHDTRVFRLLALVLCLAQHARGFVKTTISSSPTNTKQTQVSITTGKAQPCTTLQLGKSAHEYMKRQTVSNKHLVRNYKPLPPGDDVSFYMLMRLSFQ